MTGFYPFNPALGQVMQTGVEGVTVDRGFIAHLNVAGDEAPAADADAVHDPVPSNGSQQVITTGFTQPDVPRNITATAAGTAGDIKAIAVTVTGTNFKDEVISETLPAFTVDTEGTVQGNKAFKTVTSWTLPAHDGAGASTSLGWGNKLGLPFALEHNTVLAAYLGGVRENALPTMAVDADNIESNTVLLNSNLDGSDVDLYLVV